MGGCQRDLYFLNNILCITKLKFPLFLLIFNHKYIKLMFLYFFIIFNTIALKYTYFNIKY